MQETKPTRWYACSKDAFIIALVIAFSFLVDPIGKAYQILRWRDDLGLLSMIVMLAIMLIACTFICVRHFWTWFAIGVLGIRASFEAWIFLYNPIEYYKPFNYIHDTIINWLIFSALMTPAMTVLYRLKKKYVEKQSEE